MPSIPEESAMDEFVNWDIAAPAAAGDAAGGLDDFLLSGSGGPAAAAEPSMDLVLEDVAGDDFSFWALEHFEPSNLAAANVLSWDGRLALADSPPVHDHGCQISQGEAHQCPSSGLAHNQAVDAALSTSNLCGSPSVTFGARSSPEQGHSATPSSSDLQAVPAGAGGNGPPSPKPPALSKVGARFSRESVKILKNWLSSHARHPYPSEEEKEVLQRQTGLNKTQITNWLANARRRSKIQAPPQAKSWPSSPIEIPQRPGTPSLHNRNPMERWVDSPPEHEPASVTAIARAVRASASNFSSGVDSPHSLNYTDDGSGRSLCNQSSISSLGTSNSSNGSFASAYSHASHGSLGSIGSMGHAHRRRRRRAAPKRPEEKTQLRAPLKTFQCTFCTETFRTKHDWQRHEKSLHLSLERWVCAPAGPTSVNPETNVACCVFCGQAHPDEAHVESHNYSACQERTLEERTFYRKDHLRQHLKLVHDVKFLGGPMDTWKAATPEFRSRCGFCGVVFKSWPARIDHVAEHFKAGSTMADWKGDWGFDSAVLHMVENSIPPYLIHTERGTPLPFTALQASAETPVYAYELIKVELVHFVLNKRDFAGVSPADDEMQLEACRIVFGAEVLSKSELPSTPNWLRDLIMSSEQLALQARLQPIRGSADSHMSVLKINGTDDIFQNDRMEKQMVEYARARSVLGLPITDGELQVEACNIIGRMEETSTNPSELVANFFLRLAHRSPAWLAAFRQRAQIPPADSAPSGGGQGPAGLTLAGPTVQNYSRLESELAGYVCCQLAMGRRPTDADLQKQARIIVYEFDDTWNQTAADHPRWLSTFKARNLPGTPGTVASSGSGSPSMALDTAEARMPQPPPYKPALFGVDQGAGNAGPAPHKVGPFFLNDVNCYRRIEQELSRFVAAAMSPNNPNRHVPSDEELQHQARWILYDDDDPWNQTPADNAEWLLRFKRGVGILPPDSGPGLPSHVTAWHLNQGGSGFAPPYMFPRPGAEFPREAVVSAGDGRELVRVSMRHGTRFFPADARVARRFVETLASRYPAPAAVFCSRELEAGLLAFVGAALRATGLVPGDDAVRAEARRILGRPPGEPTPADDAVLLDKFRALVGERLGAAGAEEETRAAAAEAPPQADLAISDRELQELMQGMEPGAAAEGGGALL